MAKLVWHRMRAWLLLACFVYFSSAYLLDIRSINLHFVQNERLFSLEIASSKRIDLNWFGRSFLCREQVNSIELSLSKCAIG